MSHRNPRCASGDDADITFSRVKMVARFSLWAPSSLEDASVLARVKAPPLRGATQP